MWCHKTFSINIKNPTPFLLQNPVVTIVMPPGMNYQAGSFTGGTIQSVNGSTLIISIADLAGHPASASSINLTFVAFADCDIIPFLFAGNISDNYVKINYLNTSNNTAYYDDNRSVAYLIKQPSVAITNITNQTYSGAVGDVFVRCITVINGGLGELSELKLEDVHGSGLAVNSTDKGTRTTNGTIETITFTGADFATIGNGNTIFETGETITLCETITILNCVNAQSDYKAYWGCNAKECQNSTQSGNVTFPGLVPHLVFSPNQGNIWKAQNPCFGPGNPMQQELRIVNNGTGDALNVLLDIHAQPADQNSYIDMSSVTIQNGMNGATASISNPTVTTGAATSCQPAGLPINFQSVLPVIHPGDTIYIKFNSISCCSPNTGCSTNRAQYKNGFQYSGSYKNLCNTNYTIVNDWIEVYSYLNANLLNNNIPSGINGGDVENFSFLFNDYNFFYPQGVGHKWVMKFILPPCMVLSGDIDIIDPSGASTWTPNLVTTSGNTVSATFNGMPPFNLTLASLNIDLTPSCGSGGCTGSIGVEISYVPDASCGCEISFSCINSTPVKASCPIPGSCPEGMLFNKFKFKRSNYGKPDNEAGGGDGIPDASGSLNLSKIRTDRAMFKDTVTAYFNGTVKTGTLNASWQNCYATTSITNGDNFQFIGATLKIYRANALIATCNAFTPIITGVGTPTVTYKYNLSVSALGACLPVGFNYQNNDSLLFEPQYQVIKNIGGAQNLSCNINPEFYTTNATNAKFQCNDQIGSCSIVGYYYHIANTENYNASSCNITSIYQNYYLSIGQCCSNYNGGNMFPFEYRNWAHLQNMKAILPPNYDFVDATIYDYRTKGTGGYATSTSTIAPISVATRTLTFNAETLYAGYGGTFPLSDDGFVGTLKVNIRPTCAVTQDVWQEINYLATFNPINALTGLGAATTTLNTMVVYGSDFIKYDGPEIQMQADLLSVNVPNDTTGWIISLTNNTSVNAHNVWIAAPTISGVSVLRVYDLDNHTLVTPINGIYQLGMLNTVSVRKFLMVADFSNCSPDSIIVYTGWNCTGYPTSLAAYPCVPEKLTLKETPLLPNLVTYAQGPAGNVALCDTSDYVVTIRNVQLGTAYNIALFATLPVGVNIVQGTSMVSYPSANSFTLISNPTLVSGTLWKWDISAINSQLGAGGIKGVLDSLLAKVILKFKVIASCGYTSGSVINFSSKAYAACGAPTGDEVSLSSNLSIQGASPPYLTQIKLNSNFITPCSSSNTMNVSIINKGPLDFQNIDSIMVTLPNGVSYLNSSFIGIRNSPINTVPHQSTLNGATVLIWQLTTGVSIGDSVVFKFNYQGNPTVLNCNTSVFNTKTIVKQNLPCISGSNCDVAVLTGDTSLIIFTYKPYLSFNTGTATAVPDQTTGEIIDLGFNILNSGENIQAGTPTIISYYYDTNGDNVFSATDSYITRDTITVGIGNNASYHYSTIIKSIAGKACNILAVLDTAINYCSCTSSQLILHPPLINAGNDISICAGSTGTIGALPITGYTYSWEANSALSSTLIANPTVVLTNTTSATITYTFVLTTNRISCTTKDTVFVNIYPFPVPSFNPVLSCINAEVTFSNTSTILPPEVISKNIWSFDSNASKQTDTLFTQASPTGLTYNVIGIHTVTLTTVSSNSCSAQITNTIMVYQKPVANFSTTIGCFGVATTFTNLSTSVDGIITASDWDYTSDQVIDASSQYSTTNIFNASGDYTTTLIVTTINECTDTISKLVTVWGMAIPNFEVNPVCIGSVTNFTNTTDIITNANVGGVPSYTWNLGDGSAESYLANPIHTYTTTANINSVWDATLTAKTINGCVSNTVIAVNAYALPTASFTADSACFNTASQITDLSNGNGNPLYSYTWDFLGLGSPMISQVPVVNFIFPTPGLRIVNYTVTSMPVAGLFCTDRIFKPVWVHPSPSPTITTNNVCINQQPLSFDASLSTITMGDNVNYDWNYGDMTTANGITTTHSFVTSGVFLVSLTVTSAENCVAVLTKTVEIYPKPSVVIPDFSICYNTLTTFSASNANTAVPIVNWNWDLNNYMPTIEYVGATVNYTFTTAGTQTIHLITETQNGCKDTLPKIIYVDYVPVPQFTSTTPIGCPTHCVTFTNLTPLITPPGVNTLWTWDFGDGTVIASNTGDNQEHCFINTDELQSISHNVKLTVLTDKGCYDSIVKPSYVTVYPTPKAAFEVSPNSLTVLEPLVVLDNQSTNFNTWVWSFGDGSENDSTNLSPSHIYQSASANTYIAYLIVKNNYGCTDTAVAPIVVGPEFTFYIPNTFTPGNNDGFNDFFTGKGIGIIKFEMWIYDRWGENIYYSDDIYKGWDGKVQGKGDEKKQDVYTWKVNLTDVFNKNHNYIGHVTLLR